MMHGSTNLKYKIGIFLVSHQFASRDENLGTKTQIVHICNMSEIASKPRIIGICEAAHLHIEFKSKMCGNVHDASRNRISHV